MAIDKANCISMEDAKEKLGLSKGTFYAYLNYLNIQRHKFPFDRRSYILNLDMTRLIDFKNSNTRG